MTGGTRLLSVKVPRLTLFIAPAETKATGVGRWVCPDQLLTEGTFKL